MSGGHWNNADREIEEVADKLDYIKETLYKVSETAHIIDYAESGDTDTKDAKEELYNLWKDFFEEKYNQ